MYSKGIKSVINSSRRSLPIFGAMTFGWYAHSFFSEMALLKKDRPLLINGHETHRLVRSMWSNKPLSDALGIVAPEDRQHEPPKL